MQEWINTTILSNYEVTSFISNLIYIIFGFSSISTITSTLVFTKFKNTCNVKIVKIIKSICIIVWVPITILFIYNLLTHTFDQPRVEGTEDKIYFGKCSGNLPNENGALFNGDKLPVYVGNFKQGKFDGDGTTYGTYKDSEGVKSYIIYKGTWKNNMKDGKGVLYGKKNGEPYLKYQGDFLLDKKNGLGTLYTYEIAENGTTVYCVSKYTGAFAYDKKCGYGVLLAYDESGNVVKRYRGTWWDDMYFGIGILEIISVNYGKVIYHGIFENNKCTDEGVWYKAGNKTTPIRQGNIDENENFDNTDIINKYPYPDDCIWG